MKHKTKINKFGDMQKSISQLKGRKVQVGVFSGENAWLAAIHEYGCTIRVTPKMRNWLHYQGVHLKSSTSEIVIPERSFLRSGFDANSKDVIAKTNPLLKSVLGGGLSSETFLKQVGMLLMSAIKDFANDLGSPPNSPLTIKWKGSATPLVDTGSMIDSIRFEVE